MRIGAKEGATGNANSKCIIYRGGVCAGGCGKLAHGRDLGLVNTCASGLRDSVCGNRPGYVRRIGIPGALVMARVRYS